MSTSTRFTSLLLVLSLFLALASPAAAAEDSITATVEIPNLGLNVVADSPEVDEASSERPAVPDAVPSEAPVPAERPELPSVREEDPAAELTASGELVSVPGVVGGQLTFDSSTGTITDCEITVTSANIPATINGTLVTAIGYNAFENCSALNHVTLSGSIKSIGSSAFTGCSALKALIIPEGVTSLGYYMIKGTGISSITVPSTVTSSGSNYGNGALAGCTTLTEVIFAQGMTKIPANICASSSQTSYIKSVTIPDSVTTIGNDAFYKCANLENAFLPAALETIGSRAFMECTTLSSVNIPKSVKDVGSQAFSDCTALTQVTFNYNDTVEWTGSIGSNAFQNCTVLTHVTLPGSIKSIGSSAFTGCSALKALIIPEGVTSLGYYMIKGTGISSITVPSTVTSSGSNYGNGALAGCTTLTEVIFAQGMTKIPNYICASDSQTSYIEKIYVPPTVREIGNYAFYKCDKASIYCRDGSYAHQYAMDNNLPFVLGDFEYGKPNTPAVTAGVIKSVTLTRSGKSYNLLTVRQSFEKNSAATASIRAEVDWGGAPAGKILLSQSGSKYLQAQDGNFGTITPGKYFLPGDPIYVIAVDGNGNTLESKRVYLYVTEPVTSGSLGGDGTVKVFDPISFTIPDDKPVLGNQEFKLDLGLLSASLETNMEDKTFKMVMGVNMEKDENGRFGTKAFADFKGAFKDAKENISQGADMTKAFYSLKKKGFGNKANLKIKSGWEPSAEVCGYIEGKMNENGELVPTEGGLIVGVELKYTYQGQAFIVVVPVYYSIGAGGKVSVTLGVKGMVPGAGTKPMFTGTLTIAPFFELGGGIGVVYLGQVGARGKATLSINIAMDHNYQKVDLTGQAFFEIKALCFTLYEREFAHGTWTIYETGRTKEAELFSASGQEDIYAGIDLNAPVKPEDRSYADHPAQWLGGEDQPASLLATDYTNKQLRVLQTNAYPDAKPQIFEQDGTKVMIWLADNTSRSAVNKSMLVYSVYNDPTDTWSAPKAIMDNGMSDFYPVAKDGYVVWQKATKAFDEAATMTEVGQNTDIYIAKFNGTDFGVPQQLTDNEIIDAQPQLAVDGDNVTVVWTQNTENNILGYTGKNSIWQISYGGTAWSSATQLISGLNTVAHLTVGYVNNSPVVAYSLEEDNDLNTIDDREIYLIRDGSAERFTYNATLDSHPTFAKINGNTALFWYSDYNVNYVTDLDSMVINAISVDGIEQLTDDYAILSRGDSTAILWTTVKDGGSEVHAALYDGSQWSDDVEITTTGQSARYPNGIIDENGKFVISFNRIQNVKDEDYYKDGQADLCVIGVTPSYDLSVESVLLGGDVVPNAEIPVYISVMNRGELPVRNVSVDFVTPDGESAGHVDFEQDIRPGETADLEATYTAGSSVSSGDITVRVSTWDGSEYNEENNIWTVPVGQADAEILDIQSVSSGDERKISVRVKNSGYSSADNVVVAIRTGDESGAVLSQQAVGVLAAQEETTVDFTVNANELEAAYDLIVLAGTVATTSAESSSGNNYKGFAVEKGTQSPQPTSAMAYSIDSVTVNGENVTASVTRNAEKGGIIIMASYKAGQLLDVAMGNLTMPNGSATGSQTLALNTSGADSVCIYIIDSVSGLTPLSEKFQKSL